MERLVENRAVFDEKPVLENRTLSGHWLIFNQLSEPLIGKMGGKNVVFREKISERALDNTDFSNTKCCLNHDENGKFLGRVPNTLTINKTDRGASYSVILPDLPAGQEAIEYTNRGDYQGNSFRFVTFSGDDTWDRQQDGTYIRTVNNIRAVFHVGPVFDPAYPQTDLNVAMRSLESSGVFQTEEVKEDKQESFNFKAKRERDIMLRNRK